MAPPQSQLLLQRQQVAQQVAQVFAKLSPSSAVLVFGSVASGYVDARSDVDILIVTEQIPEIEQRHSLVERLGTNWVLDVGEDDPMFPVIDEAKDVQGVSVTLHYNRTAWVEQVLEEVISHGAITTKVLPFRPYTLAGLLQRAWVLSDADGLVSGWRERLAVFPFVLQRNLLAHFTPILEEQVEELVANAERHLGPRVFLFNLNWAVDALIGILYALNEVYDPAGRRAEQTVWPYLDRVPEHFTRRLTEVLVGPFDDREAIEKARRFETLALEVLADAELSKHVRGW